MAQVTASMFPRSLLHASRRSTTAVTENSGTISRPFLSVARRMYGGRNRVFLVVVTLRDGCSTRSRLLLVMATILSFSTKKVTSKSSSELETLHALQIPCRVPSSVLSLAAAQNVRPLLSNQPCERAAKAGKAKSQLQPADNAAPKPESVCGNCTGGFRGSVC